MEKGPREKEGKKREVGMSRRKSVGSKARKRKTGERETQEVEKN